MRTDILLDENNDLVVLNSDFTMGESDSQHIIDTINAEKGTWKETPSTGVGVRKYVKGRGVELILSREIKLHLENDNYNSSPIISNTNNKLTIDANVKL